MQIPLQNFTDYWPMMSQLSPRLRLEHEIMQLVPGIVAQAAAFAVAGVTSLLKKLDPTAFIAVFLLALAPLLMRLEGRRTDRGAATIQFGKLKVGWQGGLALGCLVCGAAILSIGILTKA